MGRRQRLLLSGLSGAYTASLAPAWRRFARAIQAPMPVQSNLLFSTLGANADTAFGREHGFASIDSVRAFQDALPVRSYEQFRPWIDRAARGEGNVLTSAPIRMFERSSGSTGGNKLIPYTAGLLDQFSSATGPWLFSMFASRPALLGTRSYWSVSPAARQAETTQGGLPIGFEDDTEYFGPLARWALKKMMSVPGTVARIPVVEEWRHATAGYLLADADLGFISVWNPSFLTLLMEHIQAHLPALLGALAPAHRADIERRLDATGTLDGSALWPRLALISCWTDGHAASFVPAMARWFPGVALDPKGLLATEGVITFPFRALRGGEPSQTVAAVTSHFLEMIDVLRPDDRPRLVDDLEVGRRYSPLLTTAGGLYRYHLADEVECTGHVGRAPVLRFIGKMDRVSDLCGEKLTAADVDRALEAAARELQVSWTFALLAPRLGGTPSYELYVEAEAQAALQTAAAVDAALMSGHHYRYCRELGQLGPVTARVVERGWARYEAELIRRGARAGDIKPTHLDSRTFWGDVFRKED